MRPGACPTSFGIHVAELVGFPPSVLAAARGKAAQLESTSGGAQAILAATLTAAAAAQRGVSTLPAVFSEDAAAAPKAALGSELEVTAATAKRFAAAFAGGGDFVGLSTEAKRARLEHALAIASAGLQ